MKFRLFLILMLSFGSFVNGQTAENYFPEDTGRKWHFRVTPIDSVGELMTQLSVIKVDSFAVEANLHGRESKGFLTKTAPQSSVPFLPYLDTLVYSVDNNVVSQYFDFGAYIDTSMVGEPGLVALLNSLRDWYPIFDFGSSVGNDYELFSLDTAITINDQNIPMRLEVDAQRENDETISTILGNLDTKKFEVSFKVSYLINLPPPLPPLAVRLLTYPNYFWISEGNWIVKEYAPETTVDLSNLGFPSFYIPGRQQDLIEQPAFVVLQEPAPGEILFVTDTVNISWNSRNTENLRIEVSSDSGAVWQELYESFPANNPPAKWVVDGPATKNWFLKLTAVEDTFAVAQNFIPYEVRLKPQLVITGGIVGNDITQEDVIEITWNAENSQFVNIVFYDFRNGITEILGNSIEANTGSFLWEVNSAVTDSAAIRLEDAEYPRFYVESGIFKVNELTGFSESSDLPEYYVLDEAWPNPFNPSTKISFGLPEPSDVKISLYNILGQKIANLADDKFDAGYHQLVVYGENLTSGIYFVVMNTKEYNFTKKIVLVK